MLLSLREKVFSTPPRDIDDLCKKIIREFNALRDQPAFVSRAVRNMHRRTMLCVANEGGAKDIVPVNKNYLVSLFDVVIFPA